LKIRRKLNKESAKRKSSAKGRETDKRFGRGLRTSTKGVHRKSYSEVIRDPK